MARITAFTVDDAFPLYRVNRHDRRFMSRQDMDAWEEQVQALMVEIEQRGLHNPVHIARLIDEQVYVAVAGFTRVEAVSRLGWTTIRANVYVDMPEAEARVLNAGDNAWHKPLTDWERALQMQKLKTNGTPVESANGGESLTRLFGMSKRTIFNWLGIVSYDAPSLHQAIADKKLGLQHALVFRDYPTEITEAWVERCIEREWYSKELKGRLLAVDEQSAESATLHSISTQASDERATMHGADDAVHPQLSKAGRYLLQVTQQQVNAWDAEEQQEVKDALRRLIKVIANHPQE